MSDPYTGPTFSPGSGFRAASGNWSNSFAAAARGDVPAQPAPKQGLNLLGRGPSRAASGPSGLSARAPAPDAVPEFTPSAPVPEFHPPSMPAPTPATPSQSSISGAAYLSNVATNGQRHLWAHEPLGDGSTYRAPMRAASMRMQSSSGRPGSRYLPHDWRSAFHSDSLASHYAACTAAALTALPAEDERTMLLPPTFNRVWPLDDIASHGTSDSLGFVSDTFKAVQEDGLLCTVRRVDGARASPAHLSKVRTMWSQVSHPNLLPLLNCFMAAGAAFFVREFCAGAVALPALVSQQGPLPEHNLRRWTSQLLAVLATAHAAGLSFRRLPAAHILIGEFGVLRVNHCGLMDALDRAGTDSMAAQQAQDLRAAAAVLLYAATSEPLDVIMDSPEHATAVLGRAKSLVSAPLHALLEQSLSASADGRVTAAGLVQQSMAAWGSELLALSQRHSDAMSAHLASSATNGRLLRSLVKLGFVNERLEHEGDPAWAETGDRYMLKLFRDWLFHQVNEAGKPVLDVGHVMAGLLKMDAGVESERALLSSRDGTAFMGVTFSYLRTMLNKSYAELASVAAGPSMETVGAMAAAEHRRQTRQQQTLLRQLGSGLPSMHSSAAPAMPHEPAPASAGYPAQQHSAPSSGSIWGARRTASGPAAARSPVPEFVPGKGMQYR